MDQTAKYTMLRRFQNIKHILRFKALMQKHPNQLCGEDEEKGRNAWPRKENAHVPPTGSYTWTLLQAASPDQWSHPGNEYLLQEATFGLWECEPVQLFLQLALLLLQSPLILQEFTLLHLQAPHLLLAGFELVLQFCQSGQQCITLWWGGGRAGLPCKAYFGGWQSTCMLPAPCDVLGPLSSLVSHFGLITLSGPDLYAKGKPHCVVWSSLLCTLNSYGLKFHLPSEVI